jgi:hypothetical protein
MGIVAVDESVFVVVDPVIADLKTGATLEIIAVHKAVEVVVTAVAAILRGGAGAPPEALFVVAVGQPVAIVVDPVAAELRTTPEVAGVDQALDEPRRCRAAIDGEVDRDRRRARYRELVVGELDERAPRRNHLVARPGDHRAFANGKHRVLPEGEDDGGDEAAGDRLRDLEVGRADDRTRSVRVHDRIGHRYRVTDEREALGVMADGVGEALNTRSHRLHDNVDRDFCPRVERTVIG